MKSAMSPLEIMTSKSMLSDFRKARMLNVGFLKKTPFLKGTLIISTFLCVSLDFVPLNLLVIMVICKSLYFSRELISCSIYSSIPPEGMGSSDLLEPSGYSLEPRMSTFMVLLLSGSFIIVIMSVSCSGDSCE
jgi:hypothetical protein